MIQSLSKPGHREREREREREMEKQVRLSLSLYVEGQALKVVLSDL